MKHLLLCFALAVTAAAAPSRRVASVSTNDLFLIAQWDDTTQQYDTRQVPMASVIRKEINVRMPPYFAQGDGVTDDTDAIQRAIDDANAAGGGMVIFPEGVYMVRTNSAGAYNGCLQIGLSETNVYENVGLQGVSVDAVKVKIMDDPGHTNVSVIDLTFARNIAIRDMTFDGSWSTRGLTNWAENEGISANYAANITLQNVRVIDTGADGYDLDHVDGLFGSNLESVDAGGAGFGLGSSTNAVLSGLKVWRAGGVIGSGEPDVAGISILGSTDVVLNNCLLVSNRNANLQLIGVQRFHGVNGVMLCSIPGTNIWIAAGDQQFLSGMQIKSPTGNDTSVGVVLDSLESSSYGPGNGVQITGSSIDQCRWGVIAIKSTGLVFSGNRVWAGLDGINLTAATNTVIADNHFTAGLGVRFIGSEKSVVRNNVFTGYSDGAIYVQGGENGAVFVGNVCSATSPTRSVGFYGSGSGWLVKDNTIFSGDIEILQSRNLIENNALFGGITLSGDSAVQNLIRNNVIGGPGIAASSQTRYNNQLWFGNSNTNHTAPTLTGAAQPLDSMPVPLQVSGLSVISNTPASIPALASGQGVFWNSNSVLHWITKSPSGVLTTNKLAP